jgi:hypothetical protein
MDKKRNIRKKFKRNLSGAGNDSQKPSTMEIAFETLYKPLIIIDFTLFVSFCEPGRSLS